MPPEVKTSDVSLADGSIMIPAVLTAREVKQSHLIPCHCNTLIMLDNVLNSPSAFPTIAHDTDGIFKGLAPAGADRVS